MTSTNTSCSLLHKFTASGKYHTEAMNHLQTLGIETILEQGNIGTLSNSIRARLIKPFEDAVRQQNS